jgi:peptidoglycan/xylan/chitin deacetylase (PgdA/CDA1 family)
MRWTHLREMAAAGMEIGCHTWSHPSLRHLSEADVELELLRSRSVLEERLGSAAAGLAYPFGKPRCTYGPREARLAEDLGYGYAVTTVQRAASPKDSPWELPRLSAGRDGRPPLAEKIAGDSDVVGFYNENAPVWLARALSPRGFRASTYGGSYDELRADLVGRRGIP